MFGHVTLKCRCVDRWTRQLSQNTSYTEWPQGAGGRGYGTSHKTKRDDRSRRRSEVEAQTPGEERLDQREVMRESASVKGR